MTLTAPDLEAIAQAVAAAVAPKEWHGPEDAAAYLDLSPQYLAQLRMKKAGPAYHQVGRRCLYRKSDLDAWVAQYRVKTDA
jgi:hypothetical protein